MSPPAREPTDTGPTLPSASVPTAHLPAHLQLPALALVVGVALYLLGGFVTALHQAQSGAHSGTDFFWLGRFRMFTDKRPHHVSLEAERATAEGWETVVLPSHYRSHWPEGPGYLRNTFRRDPVLRQQLAWSLCTRAGGTAIRLREVRWPKVLGTDLQRAPRDGTGVEVRILGTYSCSDGGA